VNRSAVGIVSYGDLTLATISDPVEFVIDTERYTAYLVDGANQNVLISTFTGPYDGVRDDPIRGTPQFPATSFNTSAAELNVTDLRSNTTFEASLSGTSTAPEPTSIIFLSTGALEFFAVFRRRFPVT